MSITPFPSQGQYPWRDQMEQWGLETQAAAEQASTDVAAAESAAIQASADAQEASILAAAALPKADPRVPQPITALTGWAEVITDTNGAVIEGFRTVPSDPDEGIKYSYYGSANPARAIDPIPIPGWRNVVLDDTATFVLEGDQTDGTKYFHSLEVDTLRVSNQSVGAATSVAAFGDSMTDAFGTPPVSFGAEVAAQLGVPGFQGGISGQTSTEVAFRVGALTLTFLPAGPLVAGANTWTLIEPTKSWPATVGTFRVEVTYGPDEIVSGTLSRSPSKVWTFTPVSVPAGLSNPAQVFVTSIERKNAIEGAVIFRAGRNNISDTDEIVRDYKAVRDFVYASQATPKFLALPVYPSAGSPKGSADYNNIMALNARIEAECGRDYYDLRRWVVDHGVQATGATPTAQDVLDTAADVTPTSLRNLGTDDIHLSAPARIAEAKQIATLITSKGWFQK